jgi:hypothetical protein
MTAPTEAEIIATMERQIEEAIMRARRALAAQGWRDGLLPLRKPRAPAFGPLT